MYYKVYEPDGLLYIVTDSHLDDKNAPAEEFVEMLTKLETNHVQKHMHQRCKKLEK